MESYSHELIKVKYEISGWFIGRNLHGEKDLKKVAKDIFDYNKDGIINDAVSDAGFIIDVTVLTHENLNSINIDKNKFPLLAMPNNRKYHTVERNIDYCLNKCNEERGKKFADCFIIELIELLLQGGNDNFSIPFLIDRVIINHGMRRISVKEIFDESTKSGLLYKYSQYGEDVLHFSQKGVKMNMEKFFSTANRLGFK